MHEFAPGAVKKYPALQAQTVFFVAEQAVVVDCEVASHVPQVEQEESVELLAVYVFVGHAAQVEELRNLPAAQPQAHSLAPRACGALSVPRKKRLSPLVAAAATASLQAMSCHVSTQGAGHAL